ncbi:MAG: hypothetical protein RBU37_14510 [Myxococcota bacterium]|jgi:hypothetical protein|nr:hypothetical protein [Myxococcota bacterium]
MRTLIDVRSGERRPLVAAIALALLNIASVVVSRSVGDALFLTTHPLEDVPWFFIASNAVIVVGSLTYSALLRTIRSLSLNMALLAFFALSFLVGRGVVNGGEGAVFLLCVWLAVVPPLVNILCWNTITDYFDSRQGRRLFPMISAGSTLGAVLAGLAIPPFVRAAGVENLLIVLALLIFACVPLPLLLARHSTRGDVPTRSILVESGDELWTIFREGITTVSRNRLLRLLAAIVFLGAVVTNLIDYAFKGALQARFDRDEIGIFYGHYNAVANSLTLVLQLLAVSWALDKFGLPRVFRFVPIALAMGSAAWWLFPSFMAIVALKVADGLLRFTFQNSANEVLTTPIPFVQRNRAKVFLKGAMNPFGAIVSGLLLIFVAGWLSPTGLAGIIIILLGLWLVTAFYIENAYTEQLFASLSAKQMALTPNPEEAALFGGGPVEVEGELEQQALSIEHPSAIVRREALEHMASRRRQGLEGELDEERFERLFWRELGLAFAHISLLESLSQAPSALVEAIEERIEDCRYRLFLLLGLKGDLETAKTAYLGLRSTAGRTRAHAVDLIDATLEGTRFHRILLIFVEDLDRVTRLRRAKAQEILPVELFEAPRRFLSSEHDPQLRRMLQRFDGKNSGVS